jgi:hypothetical protein
MPAVVTLMTYPHRPVSGRVSSIGWGIYQDGGASGPDLLPKVEPTLLSLITDNLLVSA